MTGTEPHSTESVNQERIREMYSTIRYPNLDKRQNEVYVRHRKYVYAKLGIDPDSFFKGKMVLDAGCGTGEETLFIATMGPKKIIGIDTSTGSLDLARTSARDAGLKNVEFRHGSVLDRSQFSAGSFDYVSSLGCIHHTPDAVGAFRNLCSWVRPEGHLCTFIYNSFGHLAYNVECAILDLFAGNDIEKRVSLARKIFDWRIDKTFEREGIGVSYDGRLYDKYGVLYRDSMTLRRILSLYRDEGFCHVGSYPMYITDIVEAVRMRTRDGTWPRGRRGKMARGLSSLAWKTNCPRQWTPMRRFCMQAVLLAMGLCDYGSAFRILGVKARISD